MVVCNKRGDVQVNQPLLDRAVVGLRQSVEHLMGSIQRTFTRLNSVLTTEDDKRGDIIEVCVRLHNFIVRQATAAPPNQVFVDHVVKYRGREDLDLGRYYAWCRANDH